jgi:hypothetical protein
MIRVRKTDGSAITIPPDGQFIELVNDSDGRVMLVFYQVQPGMILQINPGSKDAMMYEGMFQSQNVLFSDSVIDKISQ